MNNFLYDHPSEDVRLALTRLLDAMTTWERTTGRHSVIIVKDELGGNYRALDCKPVSDREHDFDVLSLYENLLDGEPK